MKKFSSEQMVAIQVFCNVYDCKIIVSTDSIITLRVYDAISSSGLSVMRMRDLGITMCMCPMDAQCMSVQFSL